MADTQNTLLQLKVLPDIGNIRQLNGLEEQLEGQASTELKPPGFTCRANHSKSQ
jgi:hypothetical protein